MDPHTLLGGHNVFFSPGPLAYNSVNQEGLAFTPTKTSISSSMLQNLRNASHEMLVQSGNPTYSQVLVKMIALEAELKGIKSSYDLILDRIPSAAGSSVGQLTAATSSSPKVTYLQDDYPLVKFWHEKDWNQHKRSKKNDDAGIHQRSSKGRSRDHDASRNTLAYIQDKLGVVVTEKQASDLCTRARSIWEYLATVGMAPKSWGKASAPAVAYYLDNMYYDNDNLRLCEGNWKVGRLATDIYPGWARGRKDLGGGDEIAIKSEPGDSGESDVPAPSATKRKDPPQSSSAPARPEKHAKKTEESIANSAPNSSQLIFPTSSTTVALECPPKQNLSTRSGSPPSTSITAAATPTRDDFIHPSLRPSLSQGPQDTAPIITSLSGVGTLVDSPVSEETSESSTPSLSASDAVPKIPHEPTDDASTAHMSAENAEEAQSKPGDPSKISLNLVDPFAPSSRFNLDTSRVSALQRPSSDSLHGVPESGDSRPGPDMYDGSLSSTVHTADPVSSLTKPMSSILASTLFKPSKTSCSELNLFGIEYCKTHARPTKSEVKTALDTLSPTERLHWTKLRTEKLAAKKGV
ncbi:hypothetical protein D9615_001866 [Tricholomella constricta]|uniref:Uncharacterized protein n=1 Tax=Tricholomella constricta TaxID=117010 RepID=A0A8H5MAT5_9AGAR|nr:hypothetical protein D9615_001866 [Tricholomella constricta]